MIDIHCHILPCIDDGSKDIEMSLEMLKIAEEDGINKIIATPHFYRGYFENDYKEVLKKIEELNTVAKEKNIGVEILPGQEIFLDNYTLQYYKDGIVKGLNDTNYMLIEFSPNTLPSNAIDIIYELKLKGIKPIIAHPERYSYVIDDITLLNRFIEENCFFQLSSGSITGVFGKKIQKTSMQLIKHGICDFVASDAHSTRRRSPKIKESLEILKKENKLVYDRVINNALALAEKEELPYINKKIVERKSIFSIFRRKVTAN